MHKQLTYINENLLDDVEIDEVTDIDDSYGILGDEDIKDYDILFIPEISITYENIYEFNELVKYVASEIYDFLDYNLNVIEISKIMPLYGTLDKSNEKYKFLIDGVPYYSYIPFKEFKVNFDDTKHSIRMYFSLTLRCDHMNYQQTMRLVERLFSYKFFIKHQDSVSLEALYVGKNTRIDKSAGYFGFSKREFDSIAYGKELYKKYKLLTYFGTGSFGQFLVKNIQFKGYYHPFESSMNFYSKIKDENRDIRMKSNEDFDRILYIKPYNVVVFDASYNNLNQRFEVGVLREEPGVENSVLQDICDKTMTRIRKNNVVTQVVLFQRDVYGVYPDGTIMLYVYLRGTVFNDIKEYVTVLCVTEKEHTEESITRFLDFIKNNLVLKPDVFNNYVDKFCRDVAKYVSEDMLKQILRTYRL